MKNVRVALPTKQWGSLNTKYRPGTVNVGDDEFTSGSKNFETNAAGVITAVPGSALYNQTPLAAAVRDQYEAVFSDGTRHMLVHEGGRLSYSAGGGTFSTVTSGYSSVSNFEFATYKDRVYFGNGITSQVYDRTTSYGGVTYTAPATKVAGCQVPATALTATEGSAGSVDVGTYYYKVTYTYYGEQESNGSAASSPVTISDSAKRVDLTDIPVGGYGVTARNIYRSSDGIAYRWVGELLNNTATTLTDNYATPDELIPEDNGVPPAAKFFVVHKDRLWTVGSGSNVYYSEAGMPDIVMSDNFVLCNPQDPITAVVVFYDRIMVFGRQSMGQIVGETPDTYAYQALPGNVGCVDNRSIQTRVVNGTPSLIWLAMGRIYEYNGATVQYISDKIEDLVSFNLQQATQVKGQNTQDTQADFTAGTPSGGISLTALPGSITTITPVTSYVNTAGWETGDLAAVVTHAPENSIKTAIAKTFAVADGTHSGTVGITDITLDSVSDVTGGGSNTPTTTSIPSPNHASNTILARKFTLPAGLLKDISLRFDHTQNAALPAHYLKIWRYDPLTPGGFGELVYSSAARTVLHGYSGVDTVTANVTLTAGDYLVGGSSNGFWATQFADSTLGGPAFIADAAGEMSVRRYCDSSLTILSGFTLQVAFTYAQTAVPAGGTWTSAVHDSGLGGSANSITVALAHTGTYPTGTSAVTTVEEDDYADMASATSANTTALSGSTNLTLSLTKRYWRVSTSLSTSDNRQVPVVGTPAITYPVTATWTSPEIDCTTDVTAYTALVSASTVPSGTSITLTAASSTTAGGSYSAYTAIGSTPVRRYVKLQAVLVGTSTLSPTLTSLTFTRTLSSTMVSSIIDCAATPAGWDVFQVASTTGAGTATWHFRTAASSGGIAAASWVAVTPGEFITTPPLRYAQWRVTLTAVNAAGPSVQSVVLNWFVATVTSARAASIFYGNTYYLSAARLGSTTNDLVLAYDWVNNWRMRDDTAIGTFCHFFNDPYYGDATVGSIGRWRSGVMTADGDPITVEIRTKAYDFGSNTLRKQLRKLFATVGQTGATWTFDYSIDGGLTFKTLVTNLGASTVVTTAGTAPLVVRLSPRSADLAGAKTIMFRARSDGGGTTVAELHELSLDVVIRQGDITNG